VVNDGSFDYTKQILDELEKQYEAVRIVHHEKNKGYGGALRTGFATASKDFIFYTDGDAQYDVRDLPALWEQMRDGVDMVQGYKISRSDPLHRIIIGRLYHWMTKFAFGLHLRDVDCDFRLLRRSIFDKVHLESDSGVICVEMMKKIQDAGFVINEVPVHHYHRAYGGSQFFNFRRIFRVGLDLTRLWLELRLPQLLGRDGREDESKG
jgi:Glycosyltransferases involved in cell wall biogenesis